MTINSVSFGAQDLNALIAQPPSTAPIAAAGIYNDQPDSFEKSSTGATVGKTLVAAGVIAGALALARGKIKSLQEIVLEDGMKAQETFTAKAKFVVAKAGQAVIDAGKEVQALFSKKVKSELLDKKIQKLEASKAGKEGDELKAIEEKIAAMKTKKAEIDAKLETKAEEATETPAETPETTAASA